MTLLVGNPDDFAIQASVRSGGDNPAFGQFRLWIGGVAVGDWEHRALLSGCRGQLRKMLHQRQRFEERLVNASPDEVILEVFDPFVSDFWEVQRPHHRSSFHGDYSAVDRFWIGQVGMSSLDAYVVLFLKDKSGHERLIWSRCDDGNAHEHRLPIGRVECVVRDFVHQLELLLVSNSQSLTEAAFPERLLCGNKQQFAIESVVRQRSGDQYFGGFRFWVGGRSVGDWKDATYLLGCYSGLRSLLKPTQRFDARLQSLAPDDVFLAVGAPALSARREGRRVLLANLFDEWSALHRFDITYVGLSSFERNLVLLLTDSAGRDHVLCYDVSEDVVWDALLDVGFVRRVVVDFLKRFHSEMADFPVSGELPPNMIGITIHDDIGLKHLLETLGERARSCIWQMSEVEAVGDGSAELHRISDAHKVVSGSELFGLAHTVSQIVDGTFICFADNAPESQPWVVIRAIDGSCYDVESSDPTIIEEMRKRFDSVTDLP